MTQRNRPVRWALGLMLVIELVLLYQLQGPSPRGLDAPLETFSAARAVVVLQRVLGDQTPHPVGSVANDRLRERLVAELRELGLSVEVQPSVMPTKRIAKAGPLTNLLVRLPNMPDTGRPLVLATHYDSVTAGPGAADAGSCVAVLLETARALQHGEPLRRPVYLLISDGEEAGLLGARAFVRDQTLARTKPFVVNFEARGTSGPSLMFETHKGNLATVRWMSRCLPRPCFTCSAFVTVYRSLPNDTDFSVFSHDGWTGLNFAFIGDAQHYHTADDTLENLDWRSVQHHGENALVIARAVAGSDDIDLQASGEDAVFCDVLGLFIVYVPTSWAVPIACVVCAILAVRGGWRLRCWSGLRTLLLTLFALLIAAGLSAALGWGAARGLKSLEFLPRTHVVHGRVWAALYWPLAFGALWLATRGILRKAACADVWAALWLVWSIAALVVTWWIPGFCYVLLIPALWAAGLSIVPVGSTVRYIASVVVASVMLFPLGNMLPIVFGPGAGAMLCAVCLLALSPLLPGLVAVDDVAASSAASSTPLADNTPLGR